MKKIIYALLLASIPFGINASVVLPENMVALTADNVEVTSIGVVNRTKADKCNVNIGDKLYFTATTAESGDELWVYDLQTETSKMVKDIYPGTESGNPKWLTAVGDKLFFSATNAQEGEELWVTDGTEAGTKLVKDIYPGTTSSSPFALTHYNGKLMFFAMDEESEFDPVIDPEKAEKWIWITDGTEAGTTRIGKTPTKETNYDGWEGFIVVAANKAFFVGYDQVNNESLWISDGTEAGTKVLKNINPRAATGIFQTESGAIDWLSSVNNKWVVFRAETVSEVTGTVDVGNEIWVSDGTEAGTKWIGFDFAKGESNGIPTMTQFAITKSYGDTLFFRATDGVHGVEPCIFDLSKPIKEGENPRLFIDINHWGNNPTLHSWPSNYYIYQDDLYVQANGGFFLPESENPTQERGSGYSLWRIPHPALDTCLYQTQIWGENAEIYPGNAGDGASLFVEVDKKLFFTAQNDANNKELWVIENREAAPKLVVDLPDNGLPCQLMNIKNDLFFIAESTKQLYRYKLGSLSGMDENKIEIDSEVVVYPNPAVDFIQIKSEKEIRSVEIFNISGKSVKKEAYSGSVSVNDLSQGVYIVAVEFIDSTKAIAKLTVK